MKRLVLSLCFVFAMVATATAQDFRVRIVNHLQMPISYAVITIEGAPRAVTDINGEVEIDYRRIRPEYRLAAHAVGYQSVEREIGQEGMTSGDFVSTYSSSLSKSIASIARAVCNSRGRPSESTLSQSYTR